MITVTVPSLAQALMGRLVFLLVLLTGCSCCQTAPDNPNADSLYYLRVCKTAQMEWIRGTHTCVSSVDSSFINLQPPR